MVMVVSADNVGHFVALHGSEEPVRGVLLGLECGELVRSELGGVHPIAIAGVFAGSCIELVGVGEDGIEVAAEHAVLVVSAKDVLMHEHEWMAVFRPAGERIVDPLQLLGNGTVVVVAVYVELVQQHEGGVVVPERVGDTIVGTGDAGGLGES